MLISEKTLGDLGGWQAMKAARQLVALGAVEKTERAGDLFRGVVREGKRKLATTLNVISPTNADCRCGCSEAARGFVCSHSLAVALASLQGGTPSPAAKPVPTAPAKPAAPVRPVVSAKPGRFEIYLPVARLETVAAGRGPLPVFLQFQPGDEVDSVSIWLAEQGLSAQTGPMSLDVAMLGGFLGSLRGHPRVWDGRPGAADRRQLTVADDAMDLPLHASLEPPQTVRFRFGDGTAATVTALGPAGADGTLWLWDRSKLIFAPLKGVSTPVSELVRAVLDGGSRGVSRDLRWLAMNLPELEQALDLETDGSLSHLRVLPAVLEFVAELDGSPQQATLRLTVKAGPLSYPVTATASSVAGYPFSVETDPLTFYRQNLPAEERARRQVEALGFTVKDGLWTLSGPKEVADFFAVGLPRLQKLFRLQTGERWRAAFRGWRRVAPVVRARDTAESQAPSRGWLEMEFAYEATDGYRIPRLEVLRLLRSGQKTVRGRQGEVYVLDQEGCEDFEDTLAESGGRMSGEGGLSLSVGSEHVLDGFYADSAKPKPIALPSEDEVRARLGPLAGRLRGYQMDGVRWLIGAAEASRGALLADDMGLGKTLQVICLAKWLKSSPVNNPAKPGPILVVCPTSLLSNWEAELAKFSPELRVSIHHGADREQVTSSLIEFDVICTSYALIVNDLDVLNTVSPSALALDEASHIRNPDTAAAKAIFSLRAPVRVALTGTPVENSVQDLWSVMQFVQPGFLGARKDFHERYAKPLTSAAVDPALAERAASRLRRRLAPFILRRTKREVVKELPDKIEKTVFCELSVSQKEVYRKLLEEGQAEIRDARRRGAGAARMTMFTVLLRLRQACNDLRLLGLQTLSETSSEADTASAEATLSGKWEALNDIVEDALGGSHKLLIFSQFTGMLRLLREWLDARSVGYSYLDGSTRDRGGQVTAFQNDTARRAFLISLKAGGYGLNLTAADHVILVEPWWNPAVEAQAIDRAHRIGQTSVVTASRLIARGTVEERILKLQATKRQFAASAVEDDPLALPGLTDDDLESLLEF